MLEKNKPKIKNTCRIRSVVSGKKYAIFKLFIHEKNQNVLTILMRREQRVIKLKSLKQSEILKRRDLNDLYLF